MENLRVYCFEILLSELESFLENVKEDQPKAIQSNNV